MGSFSANPKMGSLLLAGSFLRTEFLGGLEWFFRVVPFAPCEPVVNPKLYIIIMNISVLELQSTMHSTYLSFFSWWKLGKAGAINPWLATVNVSRGVNNYFN